MKKRYVLLSILLLLCVAVSVNAADIASVDGIRDSAGTFPIAVDTDGGITANGINFAADGESSDAYAITLSPAILEYKTGQMIVFTATTANTGACTLNVNGLGAKSLKSLHNQDPADNYIEAGSIVVVVYDGTNFQIVSPDANP